MRRTTAETSNQSLELAGYDPFSSHSALVDAVVRDCDTLMQRVPEL
ncbi:MAG TPA: hypothetical protein VGH75_09565 [Steroidobacteraceae bacterium]|jgi:hypothetical protein